MKIAPASSSVRTAATIFDCASSTTRRRCGGMSSISSRSISAARWDMFARIRSRDVLGRAAQREREVLRVDLLEHELDRAVVELEHVLEDEQQRAHLVGELGVALGEVLEDVALGARGRRR